MPESDSTKELELYSRDGSVTSVRSPVRIQILRLMREGDDVTFAEIQEATGLSKSTVSNYLNSLDEAGLIVRVPNPNDARKKIYRLSATYLPLLPSIGSLSARPIPIMTALTTRRCSPTSSEWRLRSRVSVSTLF